MTLEHDAVFYLLAYGLWALLLLAVLVLGRGLRVIRGQAKADQFPPYAYDPAKLLDRLSRAYINTLEMLPVVLVVAAAGLWAGKVELAACLLPWVFAARVGQSLVHLVGVNHWLVQARFAFLLVQIVLVAWLGLSTACALA
ncbi:MAG TPA: MAPEG family protein [Alcanivorax sp.]|nr:MAPEG family protein [Alcanivorax sp.]